MANFCCQKLIELEPKTLNEGALTQLRELAVDMILKKEPQESSNILLQGIEADINIATMEMPMASSEAKEGENEGDSKGKSSIFKCSCDLVLGESPTQLKLKEPLSAPF